MGWWSKTWKKVKNVFKKVTKVVKKIVKSVGKTAKKVWSKVKGVAKKFSKGMSKLGPFANIAMNFIPGFGQLWSAYGIWGQIAKGALIGFATTGEASGALLGAATMGAVEIFNNMPGNTIAQKWNAIIDKMSPKTIDKIAMNYGGQPFTDYTPKSTFKSFPKPFDPTFTRGVDDLMLDVGEKVYAGDYSQLSKYPYDDIGAYHMKDGQLLLGKAQPSMDKYGGAPFLDYTPPQMGGRSSDYWGAKEVTMTQEAIKAGQYHKPEGSLLDKIRDAIPSTWASSPNAKSAAGAWQPDTSPLKAVNVAAGGAGGQVGYGTDIYDVEKLGLLSAIKRIEESKRLFGVA